MSHPDTASLPSSSLMLIQSLYILLFATSHFLIFLYHQELSYIKVTENLWKLCQLL